MAFGTVTYFWTFLERTKAYRRALREAEYGPLSDPAFFESISPIRLVDRIDRQNAKGSRFDGVESPELLDQPSGQLPRIDRSSSCRPISMLLFKRCLGYRFGLIDLDDVQFSLVMVKRLNLDAV